VRGVSAIKGFGCVPRVTTRGILDVKRAIGILGLWSNLMIKSSWLVLTKGLDIELVFNQLVQSQ
jgi:hypothetical protein